MQHHPWLLEFYPISADECAEQSPEKALDHSLQKWTGLRKANLDRHGVKLRYYEVQTTDHQTVLSVYGQTCALCRAYQEDDPVCKRCPLAISRGGVSCDQETQEEFDNDQHSPWGAFCRLDDVEPMIAALEKAKKEQQP